MRDSANSKGGARNEAAANSIGASKGDVTAGKIQADGNSTVLIEHSRVDLGAFVLTAPAGLLLLVGFLVPVGYAVYLGFTNITLTGPTSVRYHFTGLENLSVLVSDAEFWHSLAVTGLFIAGSAIVGVMVIAMLLAVLMEKSAPGVGGVVGGLAIWAWIFPAASGAFTWYVFASQGGTLARILGGSPLYTAPLVVVSAANVWSTAGFAMLVLRGGLKSVPSEVLEAARLEGASVVQVFARVTVPIIRYVIMTTILIVVLLSLANFTLIFVMTQGGPGGATNILPVYAYTEAFSFNRIGYGALLGNIVVLLGSVGAYWYVRALRHRGTS